MSSRKNFSSNGDRSRLGSFLSAKSAFWLGDWLLNAHQRRRANLWMRQWPVHKIWSPVDWSQRDKAIPKAPNWRRMHCTDKCKNEPNISNSSGGNSKSSMLWPRHGQVQAYNNDFILLMLLRHILYCATFAQKFAQNPSSRKDPGFVGNKMEILTCQKCIGVPVYTCT